MAVEQDIAFIGQLIDTYAVNAWRMHVASKHPNDAGVPTDMQVEVYNNLGQLLVSQKMSMGMNTIDISNKSAGVYLLKAIDGDKVSTYKIVKKD